MSSGHHLLPTISLAQRVLQHCGELGMVLSNAIASGDYNSVIMASMPDPLGFHSPEQYARAYQGYSLLRKFSAFPVKIDRAAVALGNFLASEVSCGQINREVDALPFVPGVPLALQQQSIVEFAKRIIHKALGKFDWAELQAMCDFSNGASTRCPRKRGAAPFKLEGRPQVTKNCHDLAVHYIWCSESWRQYCQDQFGRDSDPWSWVKVVPGSRFETVSKDSTTDRPICIEPDLNMFFQKGIGAMIRKRLLRRGINLNDQTINQFMAYVGSLWGTLATIDLKSASDSGSLRACEILLPEDWYQAMLITRSPYVLIDGKYVRLEKISSMGNGFTFELESLLFWGLALAVVETLGLDRHDVSVYGDDIIVPSAAAEPLIGVLASLGFATNKNKTFVSGPFRESCGKHYFRGSDVSPFKIEDPIETWDGLYHFCNQVAEWGWLSQADVDSIHQQALAPIPPRNRCYVPSTFNSRSGLRVSEPPRGSLRYSNGSHHYVVKYMKPVVSEHEHNGPHAYLASLLLREQRSPSGDVRNACARPEYRKAERDGKLNAYPYDGLDFTVYACLPDDERSVYYRVESTTVGVWS